ncbi:MAG: Asp-tRNA(Asn)/Glu-tRNA(Gln) amidotransferase subunit GatB [Verrucomicrobiota bacterium]|nr:Asp-tRNA(Asn)/Glu-tRNA(Gln) amidotransferase subunit GatB [Verrucomicrobiota bacterium]
MRDLPYHLWEPVIGLEIHVQLNTQSKLFSSAPNRFGDEPNANISVVCTGQPGALPVLNQEAVKKAIQFGLAIKGNITKISRFDRKSYFYPDSPRNFQITQYDHPIIRGGQLTLDVEGESKTFHINRAHLEDDAGMLKHFSTFAGVDYNRAGAPLIEIVSEPCFHSSKEASAYAQAIRAILLYLDASDGNMEEGSLRIDVNISVRPKGEQALRPRIEIKNMNSFSFLEMAIESEIRRQIALYTDSPHRTPEELIPPGTYRWDPETRETILMRRKESADDYRYFPEPDLVPIVLSDELIDEIASHLPELPQDRYRRYVTDLGLTPYAANLLVNDKKMCDYFEEALHIEPHPRALCNWITVEFAGRFKETGKTVMDSGILPKHVAKLVHMIEKQTITGRIAKAVADEMVTNPGLDPETIVAKNPDYQPVADVAAIEQLVDQVLSENPQSVIDFKAGKDKAFSFLVGQVMKLSRGKATPQIVNDLLKSKIAKG